MAAATASRPKKAQRRRNPASVEKRTGSAPAGPTRWTRSRDAESIRWNRVLSAQARIATDYYERDDVKELLVDAVLDELTSN